MMPVSRRLDALESMGITVWKARPGGPLAEVEPAAIRTNGAEGSVVLIVEAEPETHSVLAGDVLRAIGSDAAWAWECAPADGLSPENLAEEQLLSAIVVFGKALSGRLFAGQPPDRLGSARLVIVAGLDELSSDEQARRELWSTLCREGIARGSA